MTSRTLTFAGFALIVGAGVAFGVITMRSRALPTLGESTRAFTRTLPVRLVLFLGWAWLGWHLFVRGTGAFK
jgi:ABC-type nitrate/sulfonate/bicarbonate transport system permease component